MKKIIQHENLGEIIYAESFWLGKKSITVNGEAAKMLSKNEFMIGEIKATVKGNLFLGCSLSVNDEKIILSPSPKWYEIALALLPFLFILVWGNAPSLCSIFPIIGGGLGGALGGVLALCSLITMRVTKNPTYKVLIGVGFIILSVLSAFGAAMAIVALI